MKNVKYEILEKIPGFIKGQFVSASSLLEWFTYTDINPLIKEKLIKEIDFSENNKK